MIGKIVGLDIGEDSVTAVQVKGGLQGYQVTGCATVSVPGKGSLAEALATLFKQVDCTAVVCHGVMPSSRFMFRNLVMPFRETKKIRQTLAFELETTMPQAIDTLLVDFLVVDRGPAQADILAAAVNRDQVAEYLHALKPYGIDPEVLDIRNVPLAARLLQQPNVPADGVFLNLGRRHATLILFHNRRIVLIRRLAYNGEFADGATPEASAETGRETAIATLCEKVRQTLNDTRLGNKRWPQPHHLFLAGPGSRQAETVRLAGQFLAMKAEVVDLSRDPKITMEPGVSKRWEPAIYDNALALALRDPKEPGFNFRREEFEVSRQFARFKKEICTAAVFLVIILGLLGADAWVDYSALKARSQDLDSQIKDVFSQVFPEVQKIVDPVQQMRVKMDEMRKNAVSLPGFGAGTKVIDILQDISLRIPEDVEVHVTRMVMDREAVQLKGTTDTFNSVDSIKKGLESSGFFREVVISSANLDKAGKEILFEIKLLMGR